MFDGVSPSEESARLTDFAAPSSAAQPHAKSGFPKLAQPAARALAGAGIQSLEQLTGYRAEEIRRLHGIGPNALKTLQVALAARGWSFKKEETE